MMSFGHGVGNVMGNRSPEAINYPQLVTVTVQMCPRFVRFALRGVLPVPEEGETDKDGVQVNGYMSWCQNVEDSRLA